ncbi:MAG: amidohydrolase family protein [Lachnospiraceae bacterium]|nr:amidohydrolase family protein [Lachnospiraceae bacterium]
MRIIDAHLHFVPGYEHFNNLAVKAEHENTAEHLKKTYDEHGIVGGIVMGNRGMEPERHNYPDFLRYMIGIDRSYMSEHKLSDAYDLVEQNLKRDECVGIKLYPGYNKLYITDEAYEPIYELAKAYNKPVAVHMGQTAGSNAYLKYSHPLTMDEAAVRHKEVQFVMCHFGNPWLMDAAAVVDKNENVAADLSGILVGKVDVPALMKRQRLYLEALKTWISYSDSYEKFMFGTDWPLANYSDYIELVKWLIPEESWEQVFSKTAERIFHLESIWK